MDEYGANSSYLFGPDYLINSVNVTHTQPIRCSHLEICNFYPETEVSQCSVPPSGEAHTGHEKMRKLICRGGDRPRATHRNGDGLILCREKETGDK